MQTFYESVLYFQNAILLHGTNVNAISFKPIGKVQLFLPRADFYETHKTQQYCLKIS
jgi:hypothetical protein